MTQPAPRVDFSTGVFSQDVYLDKSEFERKTRLLQQLCKIMVGLQVSSLFTYLAMAWLAGEWLLVLGAGLCVVFGAGYLLSYYLAGRGRYLAGSRLLVATIFNALVYGYWMLGTAVPVMVALILPIALGIVLLSTGEIIRLTAIVITFIGSIYVAQHLLKFYTPPVHLTPEVEALAGLFCAIVIIPFIVALLVLPANSQYRAMREQNRRLHAAYRENEQRQKTGEEVNYQMLNLTRQLETTARQQASSSVEQVAAVTQVTTSLEELGETANQIAGAAGSAVRSADQTLEIANNVKKTSQLSQNVGAEGEKAVEQTIRSVEQVRNRIELLGQRLLQLTEQTRKVGNIIDIIDEIADETHLLALNASIEAAGNAHTGETSGTAGHLRGERFGVIAQEVKNLSDRSREATEEVRQSIAEMQGAVAAAVLVAEEGKKETSAALSRSQIAGTVIDKLNQVIFDSASGAEEILQAIEEVKVRCDEISIATSQQRSANQQILLTMRSVTQVSQETAGVVNQLSTTALQVNSQLNELKNVFDDHDDHITPAAKILVQAR